MATYSRTFTGNRPNIMAAKTRLEGINEMFFGKWASFTTPNGRPVIKGNDPMPTESPISIQQEINKKYTDIIEIPMLRNLKAIPRIGRQQVTGFEERVKINKAQVPVGLMRHGEVPRETVMDDITTGGIELLKYARPALKRHYSRSLNYMVCCQALYTGYSWNVLNSTEWATNSQNVTSTNHPHIFCAGNGKVSYSGGYPGTSGYNTTIGTDVGNLGAGDVMDSEFLSSLANSQAIQDIEPIIMKDGVELKLLVVHPWQLRDLVADPLFKEVTSRAFVQEYTKENPYLSGVSHIWEGFAIFKNDTAVWPVTVSSGVPVWGPSDMQVGSTTGDLDSYKSYSSATKFAAYVLGAGALYLGMGSRLQFAEETRDYDNLIGIAYQQIIGASRGDFWNRDDGTTGQYLINESSALALTSASAPTF